MEYDEFVESLEALAEDNDCLIPYIPEPEMVKAVLGHTEINDGISLVYSVEKIIETLVERDHMTEEEAREHFHYNIERGAKYSKLNLIFVY